MENYQIAILGGGCYWCLEAVLLKIRGVVKSVSGFSGGHVANPTYKQVYTDTTGHAQVCRVTFDPSKISYQQLVYIFFHLHNPTTLNKQGEDEGTRYRSAIFYLDENQHNAILKVIKRIEQEKVYADPIVTQIAKFQNFYEAEDYHQNYFNIYGSKNPYCQIIPPKIAKFKKSFKEFAIEQ